MQKWLKYRRYVIVFMFALIACGSISTKAEKVQGYDIVYFYSDVSGNNPHYNIIKFCHEQGLLDKTDCFNPDEKITKDEFDELSQKFLEPGVIWDNSMTRVQAVVKLYETLMVQREKYAVDNILEIADGIIIDKSVGKGITTTIEVINNAGMSIYPEKVGFTWVIGKGEFTVFAVTVGENGSSSKIYNMNKGVQNKSDNYEWFGNIKQIYRETEDGRYVPAEDTSTGGIYLFFSQQGDVFKKEFFLADKNTNEASSITQFIEPKSLERQKIYILPAKFKVGSDGYALIEFKTNPTDLSNAYIHYNDKKAKLNELPIKTNLLGEYIIELNGRLYTTIVYDDPPLAEFQTYRKVNYINDVSEADITALNILTVKDTFGLNVIQLITKNIYVVAEKDSANILGIIKGEIGIKYTGVESEKTQIFAVGETVNYDVQNKFERWVYRAAGLKDQTTLSPITKFNSPAKYKVSYETYDGVRLSTNYKNSIGFGSKEIQTGINIPNLPNPTIPSTQFTIQETPEWFRAVSITETDKTLRVNGRLVLINLEADEWLIVNKDGEIDNTVGQIDRDMIMTVYRTGEFEAYLLYRQGSIVRRAKLIIKNDSLLMLAFNSVVRYNWADKILVPAEIILENGYNIPLDSPIELIGAPIYGDATVTKDGVLYKPDEGFGGSDVFYYKVGSSNVAQVIIDVVPAPAIPIAMDDNYIMPISCTTMQFDVLENDLSLDGSELRILTVVSDKGAAHIASSNFSQLLQLDINPKEFEIGDVIKVACKIGTNGGDISTVSIATIVIGEPEKGYITIKERPIGIITRDENGVFNCKTKGEVVEWKWRIGKEEQIFFTKESGVNWINSIDIRDRLVQLYVVDEDGLSSAPDIYGISIFSLNKDVYTVGDIFKIINKNLEAEYAVSTKLGEHLITSSSEEEIYKFICNYIEQASIRNFIIEYDGYTVDFSIYLPSDSPQIKIN